MGTDAAQRAVEVDGVVSFSREGFHEPLLLVFVV
jgi:hypothetical protein